MNVILFGPPVNVPSARKMSSETRSWEELIEALKEEFSKPSVEIDRVKELMLSYRSCEKDWKRFANFDPFR